MRLASYTHPEGDTFGIAVDSGFVDLGARLPQFNSLKSLLASGYPIESELKHSPPADHGLTEIDYLPPITNAGKIFCVGVNYDDHRQEGGSPVNTYPTIFTRFNDSHVGHLRPVPKPLFCNMFDYEGEIAVVIGKSASHVPPAHALTHVAGYAPYNDYSVRDWQMHSSQWIPGKNFEKAGSFGPTLVTPDEIDDLAAVELSTTVNGQIRQHTTVSLMIFDIPQLISYISTFTPLHPGDVIVTGTPGGVGLAQSPPVSLHAGDIVEVTVTGVGTLTNTVEDGPQMPSDTEGLNPWI